MQLYGAVDNLLDKDPPVASQVVAITNVSYFDIVGRAFSIGAKFRF